MKIELAGHYDSRKLLKTMWPSVLMMLTTSLYSIIDGWFVSNYAGKTALAAINLVSPIIMIAASLGLVVVLEVQLSCLRH